jgi:hypothetical protein
MAWLSMVPVLIPVALITAMILRRDLTTVKKRETIGKAVLY